MRPDKDRSSKWLLTHHGDAVLTLAGLSGFTTWKALQAETVAPRRLPDGLLEVRFPGASAPVLVLVEIETYPDSDGSSHDRITCTRRGQRDPQEAVRGRIHSQGVCRDPSGERGRDS